MVIATFSILYLAFLAWYDGWGMDPLTSEEIDAFVGNLAAQGALEEQIKNLHRMGDEDDGEEFFMLNLNRYEYAEGEAEQGVPAAYQAYGQAVIGMILANAGHPIYSGRIPDYLVAGELEGASWHEIILVRYRSRRDFISMVTSDEYQKIARHRAGGIEYAEVTPTRSELNLITPRFIVLVVLVLLTWACDRFIRKRL